MACASSHRLRTSGSCRFSLASAFAVTLAAAFTTGCGMKPGSNGNTAAGNTAAVILASSTANDQLSAYTVTINSLTLTSQSGATVDVINTPVTEEFIHVNGHVEPIGLVNIPQGTYVSASATFGQSTPVCSALISGGINSDFMAANPSATVNLTQPISVTGGTMGLLLDLQVNQLATPCSAGSVPAVTSTFNLTSMAIASSPTNSSNGLAVGLEGTVASLAAGGAGMSVDALVSSQTPPVWQVLFNSSTVFQGVSGASELALGIPVDMDVAIQPDGSLLATRVETIGVSTTNLTLVNGHVISVATSAPVALVLGAAQMGYLGATPGPFGYANLSNAQFQASGQFENLTSLPFTASFDSANMVAGQDVTATTQATQMVGGPTYSPLTTVTLSPQTINGTVSAVSTSGDFTTYTVSLAPYDLFPQFAVQPGQTTLLTNPSTVTVYVDNSTQMLNTGTIGVGGLFRFYGLIFDNNGSLSMDCAQVYNGVTE